MEFHEAAGIFPMIEGEEYEAFRQDIKEHGLKEPIVTFRGRIIDGRNRFKACRELGVRPVYVEWDGDGSLTEYVVSLNLHRRHLSTNQLGMLGARIKDSLLAEAQARVAKTQFSENPAGAEISSGPHGDSRDIAGAVVKVSGFSVDKADFVVKHGAPVLVAAVNANQVALHNAAEIARLPADEQERAVAGGPEVMLARAQEMRAEKKQEKQKATGKAVATGGLPAVRNWLDKRIEALAKSREDYAGVRFEEAQAIRKGLCEV